MSKRTYALIAATAVAIIYGVTFTVAKDVMPLYLLPFGFIVLRVSGSTILFWLTWIASTPLCTWIMRMLTVFCFTSMPLQKEAFFFQKPCVILRPQTEWVEIVENGNAILADASEERIEKAFDQLISKNDFTYPPLFGDGKAAEFICQTIVNELE